MMTLVYRMLLFPFAMLLWCIEQKEKPNRILRGSNRLVTGTGSWKNGAPLPSFRYEFASTFVGDDIYVIGGVWLPSVWFPTSLVEVYSSKTNSWKQVTPYPKLVHHTSAVSVNGLLYVVGGNGIRIAPKNDLYAYDPKKDSWIRMPDMPTARGAHVAVAIGNKIYAIGGGINKRPVPVVEVFDTKTQKWEAKSSMPTAREHITGAVVDGKIHILGGYAGSRFNNLTTHEVYDPGTDTWETKASLPYEVSGLSSATIGKRLFIFGGEQEWAISGEVHEYVPDSDSWVRHSDLPIPRYALTATTIKSSIYCIGGSGYLMGDDFRRENDIFTP